MKKNIKCNAKGFTLVELLVSAAIVVIVAGGAFLSLDTASKTTKISAGADEVKGLFDELKSYSVGTDREMVSYYFLIIKRNNSETAYCNRGTSGSQPNRLSRVGDYAFCTAPNQVITDYAPGSCADCLSQHLNKVRSGHIDRDIILKDVSGNTGTGDLIFITRTYDGQIGMSYSNYLRFVDTDNSDKRLPNSQINITISENGINTNKYLHINPLINTIWLNEQAT